MPWDNLKFVRTMRDIKTSQDVVRSPLRTSQQVFRTRDLVYPVDQNAIAIELQRERRRFMRQTTALERTKKKVEHVRAKLYGVTEKNRRLMQLRHQLQQERWASLFSPYGEKAAPQKTLQRHVKEIRIRRG
jgi:hypothetical protein